MCLEWANLPLNLKIFVRKGTVCLISPYRNVMMKNEHLNNCIKRQDNYFNLVSQKWRILPLDPSVSRQILLLKMNHFSSEHHSRSISENWWVGPNCNYHFTLPFWTDIQLMLSLTILSRITNNTLLVLWLT